jgi:DNA-binding response OmpR family regulator
MANILVIDNEPRWAAFCAGLGYATVNSLEPNNIGDYDLYIVSDWQPVTLLDALRDAGKRFVVASNKRTARGAIEAYRQGAADYMTKDFRASVVRNRVSRLREQMR